MSDMHIDEWGLPLPKDLLVAVHVELTSECATGAELASWCTADEEDGHLDEVVMATDHCLCHLKFEPVLEGVGTEGWRVNAMCTPWREVRGLRIRTESEASMWGLVTKSDLEVDYPPIQLERFSDVKPEAFEELMRTVFEHIR